jgi:hypothetical protein
MGTLQSSFTYPVVISSCLSLAHHSWSHVRLRPDTRRAAARRALPCPHAFTGPRPRHTAMPPRLPHPHRCLPPRITR